MNGAFYRMGIDVGSTTVKVVVLDQHADVVFSDYRRHNAETVVTLQVVLREALQLLGDVEADLRVTGSAGLGVSEKFDLPFIQEVVASAQVVRQLYPSVKTLVDIGGEDAKMIFFNADVPDIRMNGSCAGGTGAFIDEMATLLNTPIAELSALAENHTTIHPMASRCGVFAKTDVQNLLSRQIAREDIAASIFNAVVLQTLATLARGYEPSPMILFSGGPLTFLPALRSAFVNVLDIDQGCLVEADHTELLPAIGAALADGADKQVFTFTQLVSLLGTAYQHDHTDQTRLVPLFEDELEFKQWAEARTQRHIGRIGVDQMEGGLCFLGVDSGSTTTKVVLIDQQGRIIFDHYCNNKGSPIRAVQEGLEKLRRLFTRHDNPPHIARSIVTGYGEDLARTAFSFDEGMVETLAHFRAARAFDPEVSFILDIGGQDMKAIFVRNGHIQNIEINEACSSGCGSFIESFSRSVGYTVSDFAQKACTSRAPCDLGTRCTVFMNSKVKQALREGAEVSDISAGLAYSVIKNAIHKVLKIRDTSVLGDHIVVQGGTFRNPAAHKAMERLLGKRVLCPDIAELMGAYGAALTARDTYQNAGRAESRFVGLDKLEAVGNYERRTIHCRGCENKCAVTKLIFHSKNVFYTGNRCEKVFTNSGTKVSKGTNLPALKVQLLFDRETDPTSAPLLTLGIPRALNLYENFPFWNTLFVECGFKVHLSDPSSNALYARGAGTVMSENICFPAKLAHGHIINLVEAGVDRIFYPLVAYEEDEFTDALNCYNCPIIWGYPDVVRSAIDPAGKFGIPLDRPAINFRDKKLLKKACRQYLAGLGVSGRTFNRAFVQAIDAQQKFKQELRAISANILHQARTDGRSVVLLLGRPYHLDPLINHNVPEILSNFGIDVISEDAIPLALHPALDDKYVLAQWEYSNRCYHAAHWAGQRDSVEVVQLNSFGCGPDAVVVDEIRDILGQYGKNHTVIRVDEIESTGSTKLRLRSMIESLKENEASGQRTHIPRKMTKVYQKTDRHRTVLAPQFSHFCTLPLARPLMDLGFKVEILPPANRETVEVGLKYVNNEICYPAIILIGDLIKALQSGKYNPSQVAVGITQSGGSCRATSYLSLLRRALVSAGFQDIPVVTLSISAQELNEQPGFEFNTNLYIYKAIMSIVYADALSTMYHATAIRELRRGEALEVANRYLAALGSGALRLTRASILETLARAVGDFNRIKTKERHYPTVGLVGEIFVKYNSFSNHRVVQWLMDREIEVIVPPMIEFFASWIVNAHVGVRSYLKRPDLSWLLSFAIDKHMQAFLNDTEHVLAEFRYHRPHHTIQDIAQEAQDVLSLTNQFGESWLIAGEIGTLVKDGVQNVLCMQPFGCIANHVVAKGVGKRLKQKYPRLNLLFLDTDAGTSEVNLLNRLHFFINHARRVGSCGK